MSFNIEKSLEILDQTPTTLTSLLGGLSDEWIFENEGNETWSPFDVVGHLIHGEKTDWITRTKIILSSEGEKHFEPFDRFAQNSIYKNNSMKELLELFKKLRENNLEFLRQLKLSESELDQTGIHPEFGNVTVRELLAAWVVHDLGHIGQIVRVISKHYSTDVGPFKKYLSILNI